MKKLIFLILLIASTSGFGQSEEVKNPITFSGYIETYYAYDFGNPDDHNRPGFAYSFNRHNELNLNLGFIKSAYATENVRSNLAIMTGSYANTNLAAEPGVLKNIYEANVGFKVSKTKNIWVDAGVFASHIGFESAIGKDCWNLTRSILADNSPYYESGAKISYTTADQKWFASFLVLNGWQRIQRVSGNNTPAFGHQLIFKPNAKITLNSSSFLGSDTPDLDRQMRFFHNLFGQFQVGDNLGLIVGFDFGAQQSSKGSSEYNTWYSPVLIARYSPTSKTTIAARVEYYSDQNQVIIVTGTPNGFQTFGYSINFDYSVADNAMWRIEGRGFNSKDQIFTSDNEPVAQNYFVSTAFAISF